MIFSSILKYLRICRDFQEDGKNQVWKTREVIFQAWNGVEREKMQKEWSLE